VIGAVAIFGYVVKEVVEEGSSLSQNWGGGIVWRLGGWVIVVLMFVLALGSVGNTQWTNLKNVVKEFVAETPYASVLEVEKVLRGKVVMTNVYPHTAGFFTREAVFGGCEFPAFPVEGGVRPSACHTAWIKGYGRTVEVRPTHYVLFRRLFTGFTRCIGECFERLYDHVGARHRKVFENELFTVFVLKS
jgi:hypothetical protein